MSKDQTIKSAGGVLIRKEGKTYKVALLYKNQSWVFPKGRLEKGENNRQAAIREVCEETGIPINGIKIMSRVGKLYFISHLLSNNYFPQPKTVTYFLFITDVQKIKPLKNDGFERACWFNLNNALDKLTFLEGKAILFKAMKKIEKINKKSTKIDTVVVAAGGAGKRMRNLGKKTPKLLLNVYDQPFLKFLIDALIKIKLRKIYLLTGYHHKKISQFVKENYSKRKIEVIYGGTKGVLSAISNIKNKLKNPFVYMDGNIICEQKLYRQLFSKQLSKKYMIRLVLSPKDLAPTHLRLLLDNGFIKETYPRLSRSSFNLKHNLQNLFCSTGILIIDNKIFNLINDIEKYNDWDLLVDFLFKTKLNTDVELIGALKYKGEWCCIHTQKDLNLIRKEKSGFLGSLANRS